MLQINRLGGRRTASGRNDTTDYILVVRAAVSVLVVVVVMVRSGVVVFLIQGRGVGGAKALSLFLCLLQDTAIGQGTKPAQQFPIHLEDKQERIVHKTHCNTFTVK